MRKFLIFGLCLIVLQTLGVGSTVAASPPPNPSTNPVLGGMIKMGAKVFFLGSHSGLNGWFIVKDNQVQFIYATPDNKGIIEGALFDQNGDNVTVAQINQLTRDNKEVADLLQTATQAAATPNASASQPTAANLMSPAQAVPSPAVPASLTPAASLSPGERLVKDLSETSSVIVGKPSAPELIMVMDPHCPHCQATWKVLRDKVVTGALHIRLIPVAPPDTDNERAAAVLLLAPNPFQTWDAYVGGDKSQLVGTPSPAATAAVKANRAVIDKWDITATPYLVYRGHDGKIKVLSGEPAAVSSIFVDMGI